MCDDWASFEFKAVNYYLNYSYTNECVILLLQTVKKALKMYMANYQIINIWSDKSM